ncbi:major facilitator superfamily domain-containing protein 12-like [Aricia agestis]|uniref:major facilitator superfamily domain-containing protein 12-like n=1 Tax=Aricia agestis TaxID=91739 RepID=UPI001C2065B6|nr:major facilitator superfamily domain-containing protein 12-like [Aricia agestis]
MDSELLDISTSNKLQLAYGIGHILNDVCASLWFTYFLVFFHLVLEFSASQAGYLMLIGQFTDALATPFVGYHSDHTDNLISAKYGKRKLWHLFGTVCVLISFPFIFVECIGCSTTHKWAQMYYYSAFIIIFQIGWASVQISHLSLIPELAEDPHVRTHLTAIRYGFTVFSNLFVYICTWLVLHLTGKCDTEQIGPTDAWKFKHIVLIVLGVGTIASIVFHCGVSERPSRTALTYEERRADTLHTSMFRKPILYQIAGIYMSTRLVVNVSQMLIPLYLHRTLGLPARTLAVVPLAIYVGSLFAAGLQRLAPRSITRKINYFLGSACSLSCFAWIYLDYDEMYKIYYIYLVAVLIGFGGAQMLVTSLALTADLIGESTHASAFIYGIMSFTDKLSCGLTIAVIQMFAEQSGIDYYRLVLAGVCGGATILGLALTLLLPNQTHNILVNEESSSVGDHSEIEEHRGIE